MKKITLYEFQKKILEKTKKRNRVAYYLDMGLGKTFVGSEKAVSFGKDILLLCQLSKMDDWKNHFEEFYDLPVRNLRKEPPGNGVNIINYDLIFRRKIDLRDFTLVLDESSKIQNDKTKTSKAILKLKAENVILLSGTPVSGKYENLWSQLKLLGYNITKRQYEQQYVIFRKIQVEGLPIKIPVGYKNIDRLKQKLKDYGAIFMKTEEVIDLPEKRFIPIYIEPTPEYKKFKKDKIIQIGDTELVGSRTLTYQLYLRMLASQYSKNKLNAFKDILESTNDRLIVFYNFNEELSKMSDLVSNRPISVINGKVRDLKAYENEENSVTFIQYQAGAMGLNLQKANKIIYFSPGRSSELYEQSKKRIHRIGQKNSCIYYQLITKNSIDEDIYEALKMRRDYTDELFRKKF